MQRLGIPTAHIVGDASNSQGLFGSHSWNMVLLGGEYYIVDCTYDNAAGRPWAYRYFNVTDADISGTHRRWDISKDLPIATGTQFSYANYYNNNANGFDFSGLNWNETTLPSDSSPIGPFSDADPTPVPTPDPTPVPTPDPTPVPTTRPSATPAPSFSRPVVKWHREEDGSITIQKLEGHLTRISLPTTIDGGTVTRIANDAFSGCPELRTLELPERLRAIGNRAFQGTALTELVLPATTSSIEVSAFEGCTQLESILIRGMAPMFVTRRAFADCTGIREVAFDDVRCTLDDTAFEGCRSIRKVYHAIERTDGDAEILESLFPNATVRYNVDPYEIPMPVGDPENAILSSSSGAAYARLGSQRVLMGLKVDSAHADVGWITDHMFTSLARNETVAVEDKRSTPRSSGQAHTGDMVVFEAGGQELSRSTLVIAGDIVGSGRASITQLVVLCKHLSGDSLLSGIGYLAADLNQDGDLTLTDLVSLSELVRSQQGAA